MADALLESVILTDTPSDNEAVFEIKNTRAVSVYVDYQKGTESHAHVLVSFSSIKDDSGNEIWFDWSDINQVQGVEHHLVENDPFKFSDSGKYRLPPIQTSFREDKIRIQVWGENVGASAGTMSIYFVKDREVE